MSNTNTQQSQQQSHYNTVLETILELYTNRNMGMVSVMDLITNLMITAEKIKGILGSEKSNTVVKVLEMMIEQQKLPEHLANAITTLLQMKPMLLGIMRTIVDASKGRLAINKKTFGLSCFRG